MKTFSRHPRTETDILVEELQEEALQTSGFAATATRTQKKDPFSTPNGHCVGHNPPRLLETRTLPFARTEAEIGWSDVNYWCPPCHRDTEIVHICTCDLCAKDLHNRLIVAYCCNRTECMCLVLQAFELGIQKYWKYSRRYAPNLLWQTVKVTFPILAFNASTFFTMPKRIKEQSNTVYD